MNKILVTGAGGFIGSFLTERLAVDGFNVKAFIRYNSKNSWGWIDKSIVKKDIEIICGDIRDFDSVSKALEGCDTVFHLAALIGIPYSYFSPLAYIKTNLEGTYNILEASRLNKLENVIITSTSEVYGTAQYTPIDENHPLSSQSPYSASKIAADQLALSYYRCFGLPVKIARPFNTYGPRQSARAVIPSIILQMLNSRTEVQTGNLLPKRDFTFVDDTISGFIEICKSQNLFGEVTNIGMNRNISVRDLADIIAGILNVEVEFQYEQERIRPGNSEVMNLLCNNDKILSNTTWNPQYDLKSGLIKTIEWFKQNLSYYKSEIYNI